MELIDTHCHLGFDELAGDLAGVLQRSVTAGVVGWINVGTDIEQSHKVIEQAEAFENIYATVGIHPHYAKKTSPDMIAELRKLAKNQKVVGIGESGFDFHYNFSTPAQQKQIFIEQLKIASDLNLPVIVHCREAFDDTVTILNEYAGDIKRIVFHCFGGGVEQAKIVLDKGFYISFTGVVTFKNASLARAAAAAVPVERMMIETDCPYMSPAPMRKQKINEPALMIHTAELMAQLKNMTLADFADAITATTKHFWQIT